MKNMLGRQIRTLQGLMQAAHRRRAVIVLISGTTLRFPAAFVIGMPARTVYLYIMAGMYLYNKREKVSAKQEPEG